MTEHESRRSSPEERRKYPRHVTLGAVVTTRAEARELLTLEGWEFVAIDDRLKDEPDYEEDGEVWRRQIGGRVEWCDLCHIPLIAPELAPERCWSRQMYPFDPRLIED